MKFGIIVFPGSNCDNDCFHVVTEVMGQEASFVWHKEQSLSGFDCVIVPGGFSYGDYLRAGAIATRSPIVNALVDFANKGGFVLGICNGFQVLTEAGLLPGALMRNKGLTFLCKDVSLKVENNDTPFTSKYNKGEIVNIPIAHMEGNYFADSELLKELEDNNQIVFRYTNNPNGSVSDIAGICNKKRNVLGMMPHPERCSEELLTGIDGKRVFESILTATSFPGS